MAKNKNKNNSHEAKVENVRNCLQNGFSVSEIQSMTGMSVEEINSIRSKNQVKHEKEYNDLI